MVGHWEVERRFLARDDAPNQDPVHITQIYLNLSELRIVEGFLQHQIHGEIAEFGVDSKEIETILMKDEYAIARLRMMEGETICGVKGKMINGGRKEFETYTTFDPSCLGGELAVIEKTRCLWEGGDGLIWEIDRYIRPQLDLILAEVELSHIEQAVDIPPWVIQEVTHDSTYTNSELAKLSLSAGGGI
ncbi:MAG TPA: hypothetical protein QF646_05570 [Candidatus Poseidoniales archaeon]|nr:hypothetical protein [Candidatus Poseidoniales archaeon]